MNTMPEGLSRHQPSIAFDVISGAVVHAHELRGAVGRYEAVEDGDEIVPGHRPLDVDRQGVLGELISDIKVILDRVTSRPTTPWSSCSTWAASSSAAPTSEDEEDDPTTTRKWF